MMVSFCFMCFYFAFILLFPAIFMCFSLIFSFFRWKSRKSRIFACRSEREYLSGKTGNDCRTVW